MFKRIILGCSFILLLSNITYAQPCNRCGDNLISPAQDQTRKIADEISYVTAEIELGLDTWHSWKSNDRKLVFEKQLIRTSTTVGIAELVKFLIHRTRPDSSDNKSFFSEHTALGFSSLSGANLSITIPLAGLTGFGRLKADKHYLSDVLTGMCVGVLTNKIR